MYVQPNYKTKKALKEAIKEGLIAVRLYQPGPFGGWEINKTGQVGVEGPHYPKPHTWYARVEVEDGRVVKVLS